MIGSVERAGANIITSDACRGPRELGAARSPDGAPGENVHLGKLPWHAAPGFLCSVWVCVYPAGVYSRRAIDGGARKGRRVD